MGGKTKKPDLMDVAIDLKMNAKMLEKQSAKLEGQMKTERKKILEAATKGQMENAQVYAETVIRLKKEALSTRQFGVKMGALAMKIEGAARTQEMSKTLTNTVPALERAMKQMDKMGIQGAVGDFEKVFENMEVKTAQIDDAISTVYQGTIAQDEVASLIQEIQSEAGMQVGEGMQGAGTSAISNPNANAYQQQNQVDSLQARLNQL